MTDRSAIEAPSLTIINPDATEEEVAALAAVFSVLGTASTPQPKPTPAWSHNRRKLRTDFRHGPGGWRASVLPR